MLARALRAALLGCCLFVVSLALSQDIEAFRKEVEAKRLEQHVAGLGLAVIKDGKVVLADGFGYKDIEGKRPVTADTRFAIGSSTKAFIAMLTAMSGDEGKIQFSDHPRKWLPSFRLADPAADEKMTVGDLLSHRSGLMRTDLVWASGELTVEEILWAVSRMKPAAKYGEKFQYQNVMYAAAGEVLRAAHGRPWEELVRERIFAPLGMNNSDTAAREMQAAPDYALGYTYSEAEGGFIRLPMREIKSVSAAGSINSSARDMANWVLLMTQGGEVDGKRLVSQERFAELTKPRIAMNPAASYGYGWFLQKWNGSPMIHHGGNIDGFSALVGFMPEKKVGFVALTNANASALPSIVGELVWKHFVGAPAEAATGEVALKDPEKEVGTYHLAEAKMDFVVTYEGGKLKVTPTGQPKLDLIPVGERRFKIAPPAPDNVFLTFRPSKDDPSRTEAELEQSGMKMLLKKPEPFKSPIAGEELMAKVVEAMGGEENMRGFRSVSHRYTLDLENQGVWGYGFTVREAPDRFADILTLYTGPRRVGMVHTVSDGGRVIEDIDFAVPDEKHGLEKSDHILRGLMFQELDWEDLFETITVTGMGKVGEEEVYIVEKKPKHGNKIVDHVSTKTFRVLKRQSGAGPAASTDTFEDYRQVRGVWIPHRVVSESFSGKTTVTIEELRVNESIPNSMFRVLRPIPKATKG